MNFSEIKTQKLSDLDFLIEADKYFAHLPLLQGNSKETLKEHLKLVENYFLSLVEFNGLETCIDNLVKTFLKPLTTKNSLFSYVKLLFYNSFIYHDFGKINHHFQHDKMKNFNPKISLVNHNEGSHHSAISSYIFINHHLSISSDYKFDDVNQAIADFVTICFSIPIYKHHSSYLEKFDSDNSFSISNLHLLKEYLSKFKNEINDSDIEIFHELISDIELNFKRFEEIKLNFDYFPLFALLKLNYSLLTASDYYATSHYMNDLEFKTEEHFGLITEKLKTDIISNFETTKNYNKDLIERINYYLNYPFENLLIPNNENLNILRQKLGAEVLSGIEKYKTEKVFYIEAPTGGGKTNMSMIAIYKLLKLHPEINKVFYVFPFTTLITQTDKAIKETLGLTNLEVTQVHSKAGFQSKTNDNGEDSKYGNQLKNQIDNLFVNYPFTLLTHIKFFDILKSNKKDTNYLLHRLANSIVIIDELQAYSPEHWDKLTYYISNYAKLFNIRFIIMSATLPKISNIAIGNEKITNFQPLVENAQKNYLQNPNFCQRVNIKTDLLSIKDIELPDLANFVFKKSEEYSKTRNDVFNGSVYTIIEFIFKKSASEFYDLIIENGLFKYYEKFVLSGTIIEPRRKEIINFLKDENNRTKKVLLITTQVVEAGVDIDMDLGFKNQSLIDSDEQLAGRINRNVNKENCELYLFNYNSAKTIYGNDLRFKISRDFNKDELKRILQEKDFETLYKKVMQKINSENIKSGFKDDFTDYTKYFNSLNFEQIHKKFKLIDNENASFFVPLDINIQNYQFKNKRTKEVVIEKNFSQNELDFIQEKKCLTFENKVSGEKIWDLYVSLIENNGLDFTLKNFQLKLLNGIMSKFVFSVYIKKADDLKKYCRYNEAIDDFVNYNFYKFEKEYIGEGNIYDFYSGINEKLLEKELKRSFEFI